MSDVINYSEFAALAACETKHYYGYVERKEETGPRAGLHLGTLLHVGGDRWFSGKGATLPPTWTDDINTGGKPGESRTISLTDFDPELVMRATWLLGRYAEFYGEVPPTSWDVLSTEEWLTHTLPNGLTLVGRTDGIFRDHEGRLWFRELKSYGSKNRLDTINVEPQPTIYYELVRANYGEELFGILYDGIYTYQWKRDVHPPADSFRREWIDRSQKQLDIGYRYLDAAIDRRHAIKSIDDTIPNVGTACSYCGFKDRCWARLAGNDEDLEFIDENAELKWSDNE